FARVLIMQRLAEMDLAGYILDHHPEAVHLMLPMEYDPDRAVRTKWGGDWRTTPGELLIPERFNAEKVAAMRKVLADEAPPQLDQDTEPAGGMIFKAERFKYYHKLPQYGYFFQAWDLAQKGLKEDHS